MNKELFNDFVNLARDWADYSYHTYGWDCQTFEKEGLKVWCYFASESDHQSVEFTNRFGSIKVPFFSPPRIEGITLGHLSDEKTLPKVIKEYRSMLNKLKKESKKLDDEEKQEWKQKRAEVLKKELSDLGIS